jgi:hypothetical protein
MMSLLLGGLGKYLLMAGGVIAALFTAFMQGRMSGASKERVKQLQAESRARDIASEVQSDIGAMPPEARRRALEKWSRN